MPAETETTTTSGEIPAPVESEEPSDTKNAQDVSPDSSPGKPTLSLEPEMVEASPVEVTLVEAALPVEAEAAPVEDVSSSEEPPAPKASDEAAGTRKCTSNTYLENHCWYRSGLTGNGTAT